MSWGARIMGALHGEVDGADVRALLAATGPLNTISQGLADRRLEAELAYPGEEWRVAADLGEVAAPFFLANGVVLLAGSLCDAEAEAHPDRPRMLAAVTHSEALALLQPLEAVIAEMSAALADTTRSSSLPLPVNVGPPGGQSGGPSLFSVPPVYLRGLLRGAERLEGSAQLALEDFDTLIGRSTPPAWIAGALAHLRGELAAARARLEMLRNRVAPLLVRQPPDEQALHGAVSDLWAVINAYLRIGQMVAAPRLLPVVPGKGPVAQAPSPPPQFAPGAYAGAAPDGSMPPPWQSTAPPPAAWQPPPPMPPAYAAPPPPSPWQPAPPPPAWQPQPPQPAPYDPPPFQAAPAPRQPVPPPPPVERVAPIPEVSPIWQPTKAAPPAPAPPVTPEAPRPLPQIGGSGVAAGTSGHAPSRPLPQIGMSDARPAAASRPLPRIDGAAAAAPQGLPRIDPPAATPAPGGSPDPAAHQAPVARGRRIARAERWLLSSPAARHRLRAAGREDQAEQRLASFWEGRGWILSGAEQEYLGAVAALLSGGAVVVGGRSLDTPPYAPIYKVMRGGLTLLGQTMPLGAHFAFDSGPGRQALTILGARDGVAE